MGIRIVQQFRNIEKINVEHYKKNKIHILNKIFYEINNIMLGYDLLKGNRTAIIFIKDYEKHPERKDILNIYTHAYIFEEISIDEYINDNKSKLIKNYIDDGYRFFEDVYKEVRNC